MALINTFELIHGQIFSEPVYSEGDSMLVPAHMPLRQKEIDFLISLDIQAVTTNGKLVSQEEIDQLSQIDQFGQIEEIEPEKKEAMTFSIADVQENAGPYRSYRNLIEKLEIIFNDIKTGADVEIRVINDVGKQLLQDLREFPDNYIDYILGGEITGYELAKSSLNTAILSAMTAQELKLPNHKINNIVTGALLHDVGMLRLSKGITEKKGGLSEAELDQIKSHPLHTSRIVSKELMGSREVNMIALQHHERWDGRGYPNRVTGEAIDIGARIVSVADAFEAMVSKKSYRKSMVGYQAVKNLLSDNGRRFDPAVIIAFTKVMGIYPIGSIVKLNDNSIVRVLNVHKSAPLRPRIQIYIDKDGQPLEPSKRTIIDLLKDKILFIKSTVDADDFSDYLNE